MSKPVLLVFMKYPEPGRVKTRLGPAIGEQRAAAMYREWIGQILQAIRPSREVMRVVGYCDGGEPARFAEWNPLVDEWLPQPAGDLGERLEAGFAWGFTRGSPVLAIGTDCLELTATHISDTLNELRKVDAVFGPTTDGGYYLVGARRHVNGFFNGVRWSSPHTLADHLDQCRRLGLRVGLLPELADIDTAADWDAYLRRQAERP